MSPSFKSLKPATRYYYRLVYGPDKTLVAETRFGTGFMLRCALIPLLGEGSYGHAGAGGSLGYADPETGVGYGYVMNQMGGGIALERPVLQGVGRDPDVRQIVGARPGRFEFRRSGQRGAW